MPMLLPIFEQAATAEHPYKVLHHYLTKMSNENMEHGFIDFRVLGKLWLLLIKESTVFSDMTACNDWRLHAMIRTPEEMSVSDIRYIYIWSDSINALIKTFDISHYHNQLDYNIKSILFVSTILSAMI